MCKALYMVNWTSLLWFFTEAVAANHCSGNQITWINKNNSFVRCSPCPPCPPGQQFSIPCKTKVLEGTPANCKNCPRGKYSRLFDTKPCMHCKICSKRHVKSKCTSYRNAECGDCLPGYYKSDVVFDCVECDKCCYDGKDVAPPGCQKVGKCKPRLHGCPSRSTNAIVKVKTEEDVVPTAFTNTTERIMKGTSPHQTPTFAHDNTPPNRVEYVKSNEQTVQTYIIVIACLSVACLGFVCVFLCLIYYKAKEKRTYSIPVFQRHTLEEYKSTPSPNDRTLRDFMENGHDVFEGVCVHLNSLREGRYDFDRIGKRLNRELTRTQRQGLLNNAGQNPTKDLFEILCCSNPKYTVKQFAQHVKEIRRNDVYLMLEPFLEIS